MELLQDGGTSNAVAPLGPNKAIATALLKEEDAYAEKEAMLVMSARSSSRSCSGRRSSSSSTTGSRQDFQHQLREQVAAAQHGHRGLETALSLMCERLLDLEECWGGIQEVRIRRPLLWLGVVV